MSTLYYDPSSYEVQGIKLFVPDPEQVKASYENGSCIEFPYWSRVWPSALALASWLNKNHHYTTGKKIFEAGAGTGLPSFVAARHASSVLISDHIPLALDWINFNIASLGLHNARSLLFDWHASTWPSADLVLLSDVGYQEEDFDDVHTMIHHYISAGSVVVLAVPARRISAKFIEALEDHVVDRDLITISETEVLVLVLATGSLF